MRRRELIKLLGGAMAASAVCRPPAAQAQRSERGRRIGMLLPYEETDPEAQLSEDFMPTFRVGYHP